eukprot:TRINITY_DN3015_c0_g1_i1.p1 TRINITY_DN3015_c0_g1~~TRINITY_DN3015_c0_g1_i1.p1  ORF type:complete len:403 (+),score=93.34 TRINITY_DN3015_c0_g1_i1:112-1320(+)
MMRFPVIAGALAAGAVAQDSQYYDAPPNTVLGCKCKSECKTSITFNCYVAPYCSVESADCAHGKADWSITAGYYDYCQFDADPKYEDLKAADKHKMLLSSVEADTSSSEFPNPLKVLGGVMSESVMTTFDAVSDIFVNPERKKYIHSVGAVGGIKFESSGNHPYTGVFQGSEYGFIRVSSAKAPDSAYTPGAAFKFLRDGKESANFVAMPSLDGQACTESNFFSKTFSNHISATDNFGLKLIAAKFWQASYCPLMVGLSDLADDGVFPFQLVLHPLVEVDCPCSDYRKCLENMGDISVGTKLFEVFATSAPGEMPKSIGHITATSKIVPSKFGDEKMFFKHQHMEDDFAIKPEWLEKIDKKQQCGMGCATDKVPSISKGCSSPFNGTETLAFMRDDDVSVVV